MRRTLGPLGAILATLVVQGMTLELSDSEVTLAPPLPQCEAYQACSAEVSLYPLLPVTEAPLILDDTTPENAGFQEFSIMEGSGEGSGAGDEVYLYQMAVTTTPGVTVFPLYDEYVSTPIFDFNASAEVSQKRLCKCGDDSQGEEKPCSFSTEANTLSIDRTVKLAFCSPPSHKKRCIGRRSVIRIIGEIHDSGEAIQSITDTQIFCHCEGGYRRIGIEPWGTGYAFLYQCNR